MFGECYFFFNYVSVKLKGLKKLSFLVLLTLLLYAMESVKPCYVLVKIVSFC